MKRIGGIGDGSLFLSKIWWIVGTAVNQFALRLTKSRQNSDAEKRAGTMTDPQLINGARKPASSPWTWNSGITRSVRSEDVRIYVFWMLTIVRHRFLWVNGT